MTVFALLAVALAATQDPGSWSEAEFAEHRLGVAKIGASATLREPLSDAEFARRVLAVARIGAPAAPALAALRELGLTCNPVVVRAVPGSPTVTRSRHNHYHCADDLHYLQGCAQDIDLYFSGDLIASIELHFEEFPTQIKGSGPCKM